MIAVRSVAIEPCGALSTLLRTVTISWVTLCVRTSLCKTTSKG